MRAERISHRETFLCMDGRAVPFPTKRYLRIQNDTRGLQRLIPVLGRRLPDQISQFRAGPTSVLSLLSEHRRETPSTMSTISRLVSL